jgi:UDP-glucose 4-epimerase
MIILVTGVGGLIGSKFSKWLVDNIPEVQVVGIDDLSGGYIENVTEKVAFFELSLNNFEETEKIFNRYSFDYVFHFAAYAAEGLVSIY